MGWVGTGIATTTAVFPGTYIPINVHSNDRVNAIVDNILTPRMMLFRQIVIHDETGTLQPDGETWQFTYGSWNPTYTLKVRKNGELLSSAGYSGVDTVFGTLVAGTVTDSDSVTCTYCFNYFPAGVLAGYIIMSVDTINAAAFGPPSDYDITSAPDHWDGVLADLAFALAMERLILDYDLWVGRLIFAIPNIEEGGDIVGTLETLKRNAEERAYKAMDNEKFKVGNYLSTPTTNYYAAIRGYGRSGAHTGVGGYGKLRGWRSGKYV